MNPRRTTSFLSTLVLAAALVACGAESTGGGGATPDPDEGQQFQKAIKAIDGGTLSTASGKAALTVPAGALATDTTLTVKVVAPTGDAQSSIYEFGPDGTTFQAPASLSLAFDGTPGADQKAVLAWYDGSKWVEVAGSSFAGGKVTGPVAHFTKFAVVFVGTQAVLVSACSDAVAAFQACGGDPTGVWKIQDICFLGTAPTADNPLASFCPSATMDVETNWEGSLTFAAGNVTVDFGKSTTKITLNVPDSCFSAQPGMDCPTLASSMKLTCTDANSTCSCPETKEQAGQPAATYAYHVDGTAVVFTQADGTEGRNDFCVSGGTLSVKFLAKDAKSQDYILVLKP